MFAYVESAPHTKVDPTGQFGVWGAVLSGGFSFGAQVSYNRFSRNLSWPNSLACVDYLDVVVSGAFGAASPGIFGTLFSIQEPWRILGYAYLQVYNMKLASKINQATSPISPFGPALPGPIFLNVLSLL